MERAPARRLATVSTRSAVERFAVTSTWTSFGMNGVHEAVLRRGGIEQRLSDRGDEIDQHLHRP